MTKNVLKLSVGSQLQGVVHTATLMSQCVWIMICDIIYLYQIVHLMVICHYNDTDNNHNYHTTGTQ